MDSPTLSLALSTRAEARIGSASRSLSKPLAIAAKHPERLGEEHGCTPQAGEPPAEAGVIHIWKIRAVACSRLYSACRIPVPALTTCTFPASILPSLPRLSR